MDTDQMDKEHALIENALDDERDKAMLKFLKTRIEVIELKNENEKLKEQINKAKNKNKFKSK